MNYILYNITIALRVFQRNVSVALYKKGQSKVQMLLCIIAVFTNYHYKVFLKSIDHPTVFDTEKVIPYVQFGTENDCNYSDH